MPCFLSLAQRQHILLAPGTFVRFDASSTKSYNIFFIQALFTGLINFSQKNLVIKAFVAFRLLPRSCVQESLISWPVLSSGVGPRPHTHRALLLPPLSFFHLLSPNPNLFHLQQSHESAFMASEMN